MSKVISHRTSEHSFRQLPVRHQRILRAYYRARELGSREEESPQTSWEALVENWPLLSDISSEIANRPPPRGLNYFVIWSRVESEINALDMPSEATAVVAHHLRRLLLQSPTSCQRTRKRGAA